MLSGDGRARARRSTTSLPAIFSINFGTWLVQNFRFRCIRIQSTSSNHSTLLLALASCSEPWVPLALSLCYLACRRSSTTRKSFWKRSYRTRSYSSIQWFEVECKPRRLLISIYLKSWFGPTNGPSRKGPSPHRIGSIYFRSLKSQIRIFGILRNNHILLSWILMCNLGW